MRRAKPRPVGYRNESIAPEKGVSPWAPVVSLLVLLSAVLIGLYLSGAESSYGFSLREIATAFGNANTAKVLLLSSILASVVALFLNKRDSFLGASKAYLEGVKRFLLPVSILIVAWTLSSVTKELDTATALTTALAGNLQVELLPVLVFLIGALISFSTGTSWGTMGVLMPLVLPLALGLSPSVELQNMLIPAVVAAVFSGAVFGDHCSPMSDTTLVSSIACGVQPIEHVKAQLPYALLAAASAALVGFFPLGYGFSPWLLLGTGVLLLIVIAEVYLRGSLGRVPENMGSGKS